MLGGGEGQGEGGIFGICVKLWSKSSKNGKFPLLFSTRFILTFFFPFFFCKRPFF